MVCELLTRFVGKAAHVAVIQVGGQARLFVTPAALDLVGLAFDVAGVLSLDLHLLRDFRIHYGAARAGQRHERLVTGLGTAQQLHECRLARERLAEHARRVRLRHRISTQPRALETLAFTRDGLALFGITLPARVVYEPKLATGFG